MPEVGVVAIGRNEGKRLELCLRSLIPTGAPIIYVDSDSTDGSRDLARSLGVAVVELDLSVPFNAARARNAGFQALMESHPHVQFVQFVDGDCVVDPQWLARAMHELRTRPEVAVVCGRRRERYPTASIYNRICDVEWNTPVGEAKSCGGDSMMRADALLAVGAFNATIMAGEEPELCMRLRKKGFKICRIDAEMTLHDLAMTHFQQWWLRTIRGGFGALDVGIRQWRNGESGYLRSVLSAWAWGFGWPLLCIALATVGFYYFGVIGSILAVVFGCTLWVIQVLRIAAKLQRRAGSWSAALAYALFALLGKWPQMIGHMRYLLVATLKQPTQIEYKSPQVAARRSIPE